jgi:hypothetical protein
MQPGPNNGMTALSTQQLQSYNKHRGEPRHYGSGTGGIGEQRISQGSHEDKAQFCAVCNFMHTPGFCPLHLARDRETCGLCCIAHYGIISACPGTASAVQIRLMLDGLRKSTESQSRIEIVRALLIRELGRRGKQNSGATN